MFDFVSESGVASSIEKGDYAALEMFLGDKRTLLAISGDPTTCSCKVHKPVVHGVVGGVGCESRTHGSLPFLTSLYGPRKHKRCLASESARLGDAEFAATAMHLGVVHSVYATGPDAEAVRLCRSNVTDAKKWGAGYCYMVAIRGDARTRVGRLLGPNPLAVDLLRVMRLAGISQGACLKVDYTTAGLHVTRDLSVKGQYGCAGLQLVKTLVAYVEKYGSDLTIGGFPNDRADAWFAEKGIDIPDVVRPDLEVALTAKGLLDAAGRARLPLLAWAGDRMMKLVLARKYIEHGGSVGELQAIESRTQSNVFFAFLLESSGMAAYVVSAADVSATTPTVGGTAFEAVVGAFYYHCGIEVGEQVARAMGAAF